MSILLALTLAAAPTVHEIEEAHGAAALRAHEAIKVRIELDFGGKPRVHGTLYASTDGGRTRIEFDGGKTLVFDGSTAWLSPADAPSEGARFDALTWSYFLLAPFKLGDTGAHYEAVGERPWEKGRPMPAARLSFGEGVGDAPDDWYVVYADPDTHVLRGLAYIVTFGERSQAEAEKEPHAIVYGDDREVEGAVLATSWSFRLWTREKGVFGEPLGQAVLSDIELLETAPAGTFRRPDGATEVPAP